MTDLYIGGRTLEELQEWARQWLNAERPLDRAEARYAIACLYDATTILRQARAAEEAKR